MMRPESGYYTLAKLFQPSEENRLNPVIRSDQFRRSLLAIADHAAMLLDCFPTVPGASCAFLRVRKGNKRAISFLFDGVAELECCGSGGWIARPSDLTSPSYWIPRIPTLRTLDSNGRILAEEPASVACLSLSPRGLFVEIAVPKGMFLDAVVWQFHTEAAAITTDLNDLKALERQPILMWSSHTLYKEPADVYLYNIHGHIYDNSFVWRQAFGRHTWKVCSENEALSVYISLCGLQRATSKTIYDLLKRQMLFSVVARQAEDGGWYHGEWTDLMECHYRFHNAAMRMMEMGLEEHPDDAVRRALQKAASFLSRHTDQTDLGPWFFHDSLEWSLENISTPGSPPWYPSRILGKSVPNKLILNTHLDAIVALDRYREVTGNTEYASKVTAALATARNLLGLRPADWLYGPLFHLIGLTLLPITEARKLSLPVRALKRCTWKYLVPRLHHVKRLFPRVVMPGGLIERHLSPPHWSVTYHTTNLMDLLRVVQRFPEEHLAQIIDGAISAVTESRILDYWTESKARQPLGYWMEALYLLCIQSEAAAYRQHLGRAILCASDAGLGLSPSLLGGNPEAVPGEMQMPCPSPTGARLRVANLSRGGRREALVVNPTDSVLELTWEGNGKRRWTWLDANGNPDHPCGAPPWTVPARGWLWGRQG